MRFFGAVAAVIFAVVLATVMVPTVSGLSHDMRADPVVAEAASCSTGAGESSCTLTLAAAHLHPDTIHMTVTQTAPGSQDRTAETSVGDDRRTLTVSGLGESIDYTFAVDYEREDPSNTEGGNDLIRLIPLLFTLGLVLLTVVGVLLAF